MHFSIFVSFSLLYLLPHAFAQQITTEAYSNTVGCSGANFYCTSASKTCCSPYPVGYGYSVAWRALATGARGVVYTSASCPGTPVATVYGPGDLCWASGGVERAIGSKWLGPFDNREEDDDTKVSTECSPPSGFSYSDERGNKRKIRVGNTTEAELVAALFEKKDFSALAAFEPA